MDEIIKASMEDAPYFTEKELRVVIKDRLRQHELDADKENVDAVLYKDDFSTHQLTPIMPL